MIVKMKKTTVLCLRDDRKQTLDKLRDLGLLHVEIAELKESEDRKNIESFSVDAVKASGILSSFKPSDDKVAKFADITGHELCIKILELAEEESELNKKLESLKLSREKLIPWGEFSRELLYDMKEKGMFIYLCSELKYEYKKHQKGELRTSDDRIIKVVQEDKRRIWFAVISSEEIDAKLLPIDNIPCDISLKDAEKGIEETTARLAEIREEFAKLANYSGVLNEYCLELTEKLEFAVNRDGMGESDEIAYIDGYIPVPDIEKLQGAAKENGWGLMLRVPKPEENPPTLIKTPKILEMSKPIFEFIGISPGYREWDVSGCFLFFFSIFFGIIVGDAGYGFIFLALAIFAKIKYRKREKLKLPIRLFFLLGFSTVLWGLLNGTVFAISPDYLPRWMQGIKWFTNPALKDKHIQQFCFLIAAVHLSFGHLWKTILYLNTRKAIGEIGWGLLLWGNYFTALNLIVYPDRPWPLILLSVLYGLGILFTLIFAINWKSIGDILNYPFGLTGTFVDLLSYIRLFAVGLASFYIAKSFNDMGVMLFKGVENKIYYIALVFFATLIILGGHLLNIVLALLAVLVHGIRLNTLEFSNHMALQWLGHVYKPFSKKRSEVSNQKAAVASRRCPGE